MSCARGLLRTYVVNDAYLNRTAIAHLTLVIHCRDKRFVLVRRIVWYIICLCTMYISFDKSQTCTKVSPFCFGSLYYESKHHILHNIFKRTIHPTEICYIRNNSSYLDESYGTKHISVWRIFCLQIAIMALLSWIKPQHFSQTWKQTIRPTETCYIPNNSSHLDKSCGTKHVSDVYFAYKLQQRIIRLLYGIMAMLSWIKTQHFSQTLKRTIRPIWTCYVPNDLSLFDVYFTYKLQQCMIMLPFL